MKTKKYWFLLVVFMSLWTIPCAPVLSQEDKDQTEYIQHLEEMLRVTKKTLIERDKQLEDVERLFRKKIRQMEEVIELNQKTNRDMAELLQKQNNKYKRITGKYIELRRKLEDEAQNIPAPQGQISPHEYAARRKREANEFLTKGEWQKAVEVYDDIANKYPFTDQGLLALSQKAHVYWSRMGKRTEAASTYRLLAERAAHMIVELQMMRARAIADQALSGPTRGDPAILQEAVEEYRLIVDKFPGEKDAVFKAQTEILGLYRRLDENEKALQLCKELAALPENQSGYRSMEVLSQLGFCYSALERWQDAEKAWLEAIRQNPDYDYGRIMIDVAYRKLGKPEKAEEQYLTIVHRARKEKRKSMAYCYIGRLWLDEGQYERAIPYYQKALDLDAQYNIRIHTLRGIGKCYEKLGMLKEGVEVNDKLAEFIGDKYPAWHSWRDGARATAERLRQELESESRP